MHVRKLALTNVRQFEQRTLEFQPGFNLLVGENGSGKTTILRGLLAALGGTQQTGRLQRLEDDDIRLYTSEAEVVAEIQNINGGIEEFLFRKVLWENTARRLSSREQPLVLLYAANESTCSALKVKLVRRTKDFQRDKLRISEEFLYYSEIEQSRKWTKPRRHRFGSSQPVGEFVSNVLVRFIKDIRRFYWRFEPYDCTVVPPDISDTNKSIEAVTLKNARAFAMRYFQEHWFRTRVEPFEWPDQAKVLLTPSSLERTYDERFLPDLREVWEGMRVSSEARQFLQSCSLEVKLTPRITIFREAGPLSLSQLSDGEQRIFSLIVDIARQLSLQNSRDNIGVGEAIVLIDEIDVHLHPKWQRMIVPTLEDLFPNCQFIATTHSPFIVQAVPEEKVQHLNDAIIGCFTDRGIEEIAMKVMGIEDHQVGHRYLEMLDTAKEYFAVLERAQKAKNGNAAELKQLKQKLRELSQKYARNPAYQAYLELHGSLSLGLENK